MYVKGSPGVVALFQAVRPPAHPVSMSCTPIHVQTAATPQPFPSSRQCLTTADNVLPLRCYNTTRQLQVFDGDSDKGDTFPSKVYEWTTKYQVACGTG